MGGYGNLVYRKEVVRSDLMRMIKEEGEGRRREGDLGGEGGEGLGVWVTIGEEEERGKGGGRGGREGGGKKIKRKARRKKFKVDVIKPRGEGVVGRREVEIYGKRVTIEVVLVK